MADESVRMGIASLSAAAVALFFFVPVLTFAQGGEGKRMHVPALLPHRKPPRRRILPDTGSLWSRKIGAFE